MQLIFHLESLQKSFLIPMKSQQIAIPIKTPMSQQIRKKHEEFNIPFNSFEELFILNVTFIPLLHCYPIENIFALLCSPFNFCLCSGISIILGPSSLVKHEKFFSNCLHLVNTYRLLQME